MTVLHPTQTPSAVRTFQEGDRSDVLTLKPDLLSFWDVPTWFILCLPWAWLAASYMHPIFPTMMLILPFVYLFLFRYPYLTFDGEVCTYRNFFSSGSFRAQDITDLRAKTTVAARCAIEIIRVDVGGHRKRITATRGRSKAVRAQVVEFMEPIIICSPGRSKFSRCLADYSR